MSQYSWGLNEDDGNVISLQVCNSDKLIFNPMMVLEEKSGVHQSYCNWREQDCVLQIRWQCIQLLRYSALRQQRRPDDGKISPKSQDDHLTSSLGVLYCYKSMSCIDIKPLAIPNKDNIKLVTRWKSAPGSLYHKESTVARPIR